MKEKYKIRQATAKDLNQIRQIIRESVAEEKKLMNPSLVTNSFIEEYVDKILEKGHMLVVENGHDEVLEMIGEVHFYHHLPNGHQEGLKELIFISRLDPGMLGRETELVSWLYGEISNKHQDVFRVEMMTPVSNADSVDHFRKMGLHVEGKYHSRLNHKSGASKMVVPLSWINAA